MNERNSYVYAYYRGEAIIYVGIGTGKDYDRAKRFKDHVEVYAAYKSRADEIAVHIVADNLSRETAAKIEGLLIRTLRPLGHLLNASNGKKSKSGGIKVVELKRVLRIPVEANELLKTSGCSVRKEVLSNAIRAGTYRREMFPTLSKIQYTKLDDLLKECKVPPPQIGANHHPEDIPWSSEEIAVAAIQLQLAIRGSSGRKKLEGIKKLRELAQGNLNDMLLAERWLTRIGIRRDTSGIVDSFKESMTVLTLEDMITLMTFPTLEV